jgi:hypothetical protein
MNKEEARQLLETAVQELRTKSRAELEPLVSTPDVLSVQGKSGTTYQMEKQAVWDDKKGHDLRILVSIDDGGWHALFPMTDSFIVAPDGSFVGE